MEYESNLLAYIQKYISFRWLRLCELCNVDPLYKTLCLCTRLHIYTRKHQLTFVYHPAARRNPYTTQNEIMAHGFGELAKVSGIVTYKISPFEQRAFAGAISKGVPNMFRRFRSNVFTVAPRK